MAALKYWLIEFALVAAVTRNFPVAAQRPQGSPSAWRAIITPGRWCAGWYLYECARTADRNVLVGNGLSNGDNAIIGPGRNSKSFDFVVEFGTIEFNYFVIIIKVHLK